MCEGDTLSPGTRCSRQLHEAKGSSSRAWRDGGNWDVSLKQGWASLPWICGFLNPAGWSSGDVWGGNDNGMAGFQWKALGVSHLSLILLQSLFKNCKTHPG